MRSLLTSVAIWGRDKGITTIAVAIWFVNMAMATYSALKKIYFFLCLASHYDLCPCRHYYGKRAVRLDMAVVRTQDLYLGSCGVESSREYMCYHRNKQFPVECACQSHRRPVAVVHNVSWRLTKEERDVSLADAVPSRHLLDLDSHLYRGTCRGE